MKNFLKYGAIGALGIGLFFGKYLGRWIVNIIDNPDTRVNNGKPYVKKYLSSCDTIRLFMKDYSKKSEDFEVQGVFNLSKDENSAYIDKWASLFYDNRSKKYFCCYYFFPSLSFFSKMYGSFLYGIDQKGTDILATVNKNELSDATYGTKEKPIPIVYYIVPEKMNNFFDSVTDSGNHNDKSGFHGTEIEFKTFMSEYNTRYYLSYVKSKADFEKMFGKQPD
ncbi:hypothetical protein [Pedobacter mendelii]|uniref:DUF8188 domain-containing protein n=1 Tax=Pedobacter mendelii TaxID=1908240 RepID=A0ABQ2BM74_9SPHI|nr:hypothetical protein [Pedobacter mendelii]GGI29507.1 hypothetical protein GCM10008119_37970 [Pedobacter mendelii]